MAAGEDRRDPGAAVIELILSPWNLVLALCVWSTIQTLKSLVPVFRDGGRWHRTLRLQSVAACVLAYQVPGPWVDTALPTVTKIVLGVIIGTATTVLHGLVSDVRRALTRSRDPNRDFGAALDNVKKFGTVVAAAVAGVSGVYGAWLRPETKARSSYELLSSAVETVSHDVDGMDKRISSLVEAHNVLDRQSAVEIALLKKQVASLEAELRKQHSGYQAQERVSVDSRDLSLSGQITEAVTSNVEVDVGRRPQIIKNGKRLELPKSEEMFK